MASCKNDFFAPWQDTLVCGQGMVGIKTFYPVLSVFVCGTVLSLPLCNLSIRFQVAG